MHLDQMNNMSLIKKVGPTRMHPMDKQYLFQQYAVVVCGDDRRWNRKGGQVCDCDNHVVIINKTCTTCDARNAYHRGAHESIAVFVPFALRIPYFQFQIVDHYLSFWPLLLMDIVVSVSVWFTSSGYSLVYSNIFRTDIFYKLKWTGC